MTHRLLSALDSLPHYPTIRRDIGRSGKGEIGGTMEGREVVIEERVEHDEAESGKALEERRFKVGELVEYWGGAMVRGYRTDSGEPAWVKVDYGGGVYGIKMVANTRGKLRKVQWQRLFSDGSFNKLKLSERGGRVKNSERMREREQDKAEAKFAVQLRQTKRELLIAEHEYKTKDKEANERLKKHEMESRKTEKDLSVRHKRQLEEMRGDLERRQEAENQARDELHRQGRQKTREVQRNLDKTQTDLDDARVEKSRLDKAVERGKVTLHTAREDGLGWQDKYAEQQDKLKEREGGITFLERCVVEKNRIIATLRRKGDDLAQTLNERDDEISSHGEFLRQVSLSFLYSLCLSSN